MRVFFLLIFSLVFIGSVDARDVTEGAEEVEKKGHEVKYMDLLDLQKNYFKHETRVGATFTTGNTDSIAVSGSSYTLWRVRRWQHVWDLGAYYSRLNATTGTAGPGTLARYIYGFYRMDYYFRPGTSLFVGGGGFSDTIKGIDLGLEGFIGVAHYLVHKDTVIFIISGGFDFTRLYQPTPNPDKNIPSAKLELTYDQQFNKIVSLYQNVNYLQGLNNGSEIRVNSDTELKVQMQKYLALILGFRLRFYNQPAAGFRKLDTISDVSLAVTLGGKQKAEEAEGL